MNLVDAQSLSVPPALVLKMEDKKRPAAHHHDDHAPPRKKHAAAVNGTSKPDRDADMPWKDDLEVSRVMSANQSSCKGLSPYGEAGAWVG